MGYSGAHYMDCALIKVGGGRRQKCILSHLKESGMWRAPGQVFQVPRNITWEDPEIKENEIVVRGIQRMLCCLSQKRNLIPSTSLPKITPSYANFNWLDPCLKDSSSNIQNFMFRSNSLFLNSKIAFLIIPS